MQNLPPVPSWDHCRHSFLTWNQLGLHLSSLPTSPLPTRVCGVCVKRRASEALRWGVRGWHTAETLCWFSLCRGVSGDNDNQNWDCCEGESLEGEGEDDSGFYSDVDEAEAIHLKGEERGEGTPTARSGATSRLREESDPWLDWVNQIIRPLFKTDKASLLWWRYTCRSGRGFKNISSFGIFTVVGCLYYFVVGLSLKSSRLI